MIIKLNEEKKQEIIRIHLKQCRHKYYKVVILSNELKKIDIFEFWKE